MHVMTLVGSDDDCSCLEHADSNTPNSTNQSDPFIGLSPVRKTECDSAGVTNYPDRMMEAIECEVLWTSEPVKVTFGGVKVNCRPEVARIKSRIQGKMASHIHLVAGPERAEHEFSRWS